jgi:hypothetical protein
MAVGGDFLTAMTIVQLQKNNGYFSTVFPQFSNTISIKNSEMRINF